MEILVVSFQILVSFRVFTDEKTNFIPADIA